MSLLPLTYLDLISAVRELDENAAEYLGKEAIKITLFIECASLSNAFTWDKTAPGHNYWQTIYSKLPNQFR